MTPKPITVRKLHKQLTELIEQGNGNLPVLVATERMNPPRVRKITGQPRYIQSHSFDSKTYTIDPSETNFTITL